MPTPLSGIARCVLLARRLKITFIQNLKLIISFLVKLQHHLFFLSRQSLLLRSESAHLFLFLLCCTCGLRQKGLLHNCTITGNPGLLRVTLASRGNSASENLQQKTHRPKCCLYETSYVTAPIRETGDVIARTPLYLQLPTDAPTRARIFFGSQVMHFSRDLS
jgi:hypothetical protein